MIPATQPPAGPEVRLAPLVQAEDAEDLPLQQPGHVHVGTVGPVAQHDIAGLEDAPQRPEQAHLVAAECVDGHVEDHPGGPAEHGHEPGHRESASGLLARGLGKGFLQFRRVGHGDARAVHHVHPASQPGGRAFDQAPGPAGHVLQHPHRGPERQPSPGLAVGGRIARRQPDVPPGGQVGQQQCDGRPQGLGPVQHLQQECRQGHGRRPERRPPGVSGPAAEVLDHRGRQGLVDVGVDQEIGLKTALPARKMSHPWPPFDVRDDQTSSREATTLSRTLVGHRNSRW